MSLAWFGFSSYEGIIKCNQEFIVNVFSNDHLLENQFPLGGGIGQSSVCNSGSYVNVNHVLKILDMTTQN